MTEKRSLLRTPPFCLLSGLPEIVQDVSALKTSSVASSPFTWPGLVDHNLAAVQVRTVQRFNSLIRAVLHFQKNQIRATVRFLDQ